MQLVAKHKGKFSTEDWCEHMIGVNGHCVQHPFHDSSPIRVSSFW